jgi:hypothetical protein
MRYVGTLIVAAMVVTPIAGWCQTTTGRLMGTAVDESGAVLQGVSVTIDSPALIGGEQVKTTDDRGEFLFLSLAPGDYTVRADLAGFVTQERNLVTVPLGGAAVLTIAMPMAAFSDQIEVVDETPMVDTTQVHTGQIFREEYMQGSAIGSDNRTYHSVISQTAGVFGYFTWANVPQANVFGSTMGENAYFIDGMDATNPVMGTTTAALNFDAIDEIQFQTGGFEAEYGRATGGIINLVSKSGGNQFSGTFDTRYRDESFQESGDHFDATELSTKHQIFGATLGGPILRDRIWFFASYEQINDLDTPVAAHTTTELNQQNYLGKITWQIAPDWRLSGKYATDPLTIDNFGASRYRLPEADVFKKGITTVYSTELTSVLSDALLWNTTLGSYHYLSNVYPMNPDLSAIGHRNFDTDLRTVNDDWQQYWETSRKDFTTDLSWFVDDLAGSHEFKGGIEFSDLYFQDSACMTGTPNGERCVAGGVGFYFYDLQAGDTAIPFLMEEYQTAGPTDYDGTVSTIFAQDAWRPTRDLTLKLGLRYDVVTYDTNTGVQIADMRMLQPRVGVAWDIAGNGKNILRGSWGRFMHPNILVLPSQVSTAVEPWNYWYSCSTMMEVASAEECAALAADLGWGYQTDHAGWEPYGWVLAPWEQFTSEPNQSDPNIRPTYADELIVAFEREVGTRSAIELTLIDKKTRDIIDDTCRGNWPTPSADAECDYFFIANIPELRRDYRGATLTFETRKYSWLTLRASYTYSSSKGSVAYSQNMAPQVDIYPWHFDNIYGYLWDHQTHKVKLNGFFNLEGDWNIAFDARWGSPWRWAPVEDRGDNPEIPWGYHFLEPRGSREAYSEYQIDLQLSKGFTTGGVRFVLIGTALNVLSHEQGNFLCMYVSGCGFDEDNNPINMGDPQDWQTPRRYEVGFRVEF